MRNCLKQLQSCDKKWCSKILEKHRWHKIHLLLHPHVMSSIHLLLLRYIIHSSKTHVTNVICNNKSFIQSNVRSIFLFLLPLKRYVLHSFTFFFFLYVPLKHYVIYSFTCMFCSLKPIPCVTTKRFMQSNEEISGKQQSPKPLWTLVNNTS